MILPAIHSVEIREIWFGILLFKVGTITPPISMNAFVIRSVTPAKIGLGAIFRGVMWFLLGDLALVIVMILFPGLIDIPWAGAVTRAFSSDVASGSREESVSRQRAGAHSRGPQ